MGVLCSHSYSVESNLRMQAYMDAMKQIQQNGLALQSVDPQIQTTDMCQLAVRQNGLALQYVHPQFKTDYLCQLAVRQNEMALDYIVNTEHIPRELRQISLKKYYTNPDNVNRILSVMPKSLVFPSPCITREEYDEWSQK